MTGAAGGIGRAIALRFVDFQCPSLTLVDLDGKGLDETKRLIIEKTPGATVLIVQKDLTEDDVPEEIVLQTIEKFKRLFYLVNCAGIPSPFATSQDTTLDVFDKVQSVNVRASWRLQRAAVKQMLKQELVNGEYVKLQFSFAILHQTSTNNTPGPAALRRGSIVNIGSMVSTVALPHLTPVSLSPFANGQRLMGST